MFKRATWYERIILIRAGLALVYPSTTFDIIGLTLLAFAIFSQKVFRKEDITAAPLG